MAMAAHGDYYRNNNDNYQGLLKPALLYNSSSSRLLNKPPAAVLTGKPTLIQWGRLRFLIMDAPRVRVWGGVPARELAETARLLA